MADRPSHRLDLSKTFDVIVGKEPDQKRFTVFHGVLTQRSKFFRVVRSERWDANPGKPTKLEHVNAKMFSAYLYCVNFGPGSLASLVLSMQEKHPLYLRQLNRTSGSSGRGCDPFNVIGPDYIYDGSDEPVEMFLVDLYLLATLLLDPITANMAADELVGVADKRREYHSAVLVHHVYIHTLVGSPLRELIVDHYLDGRNHTNLAEYLKFGVFPPDFIKDLLLKVLTFDDQYAGHILRNMYRVREVMGHEYHQPLLKQEQE